MIPSHTPDGYLPPGVYRATLAEIEVAFGKSSERRRKLFAGLVKAVTNLFEAGAKRVYVGGSFVSNRASPNDVDGCWGPLDEMDLSKLDFAFLDSKYGRKEMKRKYGVDFFIETNREADSGLPFREFFQMSKEGSNRGIVLIERRKQ